MPNAERARRAGASASSDTPSEEKVARREDETAGAEDQPLPEVERTAKTNDPADADGLVPLIEPPGVQGQSELPGTQIKLRNFSLGILAALAVAYTLYFARSILFPVVFALVLALLFRPVVRQLRRSRIPDAVSAGGIIIGLLALMGAGIYTLAPPATAFVQSIPEQLDQADEKIRTLLLPFRKINEALKTGERLTGGEFVEKATEGSSEDASKESVSLVQNAGGLKDGPVEAPKPSDIEDEIQARDAARGESSSQAESSAQEQASQEEEDEAEELASEEEIVVRTNQQPTLTDWVLSATSTFIAGAVICLVLLYFLLSAGDDLINNVLHVLPNFREKRGVVELIYAAEGGISKYLLTVTLINLSLGVCETIAMLLLGVENAVLWGVMACAFNFIPYVGAIAGTCIVGLVSFLQFDSLYYALLPPMIYWGLTAIEGNFVTPTILGKQISLNPVMIFLALAFWGWIWGVGGALIAVPLLAMTKIVCDQFKPLQPIGKLLEQ